MKAWYLATNSNNSAAISEDGKIYVWGSRRFGLVADGNNLGTGYEYQATPQEIIIGKQKKDVVRATKGKELFNEESSAQGYDSQEDSDDYISQESYVDEPGRRNIRALDPDRYSACSISFGAFKAMAILVEKHLEIDFKPILPCRNMLRKLKRYIKRHHQIINGSQEGDFDNEEMSVSSHKSLAFSTFEDTQECIDDYLQAVLPDQYPFAKEKDFKNKFFDIDIDFDGADE